MMRTKSAGVFLAAILVATAGCSGGGGGRAVPSGAAPSASATPSPSPSPTNGSKTATISFQIARPKSGTQVRAVRGTRAPLYLAPTTQSVTIVITNTGFTQTLTATSSCATCPYSAATSLAIVPAPYSFFFTANGKNGALSSGSVMQTLVQGSNVVSVTLSPIVNSVGLTINGTPNPNGPASQVLPVTTRALDIDGNAIPDNLTYASEFDIYLSETDPLSAFSLQPSTSGSADCSIANSNCGLRSNEDSISLAYNSQASAFSAYPSYYPEEAILYGYSTGITAANSASVSTPPCATNPICVYAQPFYPLLLAAGSIEAVGTSNHVLQPLEAIAQGSTIFTDSGTISSAGSPPYAFHYDAGPPQQVISGLQYVPATSLAYTVDYSGNAAANGDQYIDSIDASGAQLAYTYPADPNVTYSAAGTYGNDIILGPDGNLWWIDPLSGDLRYASTSGLSTAGVCTLQNGTGANFFMAAYQIVATPPGVSPSRIWFSAFDVVNDNTYLGYVNVSAGSNSCGGGQTATHRIEIATDNSGTLSAPNGMAVDGSGNLWFNSADGTAQNYTSIGEVAVNGSGALSLTRPIALPGVLGEVQQDWGIVYDQGDQYLYFAADDGYIGRFSPAAGVASATAYPLPFPLSALLDVTGDFNEDDVSSCIAAENGLCFPQFSWDPGSGTHGRLTFVVYNLQDSSNFSTVIDEANTVVQLDLDSPSGITFSARPRGTFSLKHRRHVVHKRTRGRSFHRMLAPSLY